MALQYKEVHQRSSDEVAGSKDVAVAEIDGRRDEGGEEGDEEVPGPVARGGEGHGLGAVPRRVDLGDEGPDHGTPGRGVAENEEAGKDDEHDAGRGRVGGIVEVEQEVADRSKDHEADEHPDGAADQRLSSAVVLDHVETDECDTKVYGVQDHLGDKGADLYGFENSLLI